MAEKEMKTAFTKFLKIVLRSFFKNSYTIELHALDTYAGKQLS